MTRWKQAKSTQLSWQKRASDAVQACKGCLRKCPRLGWNISNQKKGPVTRQVCGALTTVVGCRWFVNRGAQEVPHHGKVIRSWVSEAAGASQRSGSGGIGEGGASWPFHVPPDQPIDPPYLSGSMGRTVRSWQSYGADEWRAIMGPCPPWAPCEPPAIPFRPQSCVHNSLPVRDAKRKLQTVSATRA